MAMKTAMAGHGGSILIPALRGRGASLLGQLTPYHEFQNSQGIVERFCLNTTAKTAMMRDVSYHTSNRDLELKREQNVIFIFWNVFPIAVWSKGTIYKINLAI